MYSPTQIWFQTANLSLFLKKVHPKIEEYKDLRNERSLDSQLPSPINLYYHYFVKKPIAKGLS